MKVQSSKLKTQHLGFKVLTGQELKDISLAFDKIHDKGYEC